MEALLLSPHQIELQKWAHGAFAHLEPESQYPGDQAIAQRVQALGISRHLVPDSYGGARPTVEVRSLCVLREELAFYDSACDSVFAVQGLGSHSILLGGDEEQRRSHLSDVASDRSLWAFALTEPEAGSDAAALRTSAERARGGYRLRGQKRFISNAGIASHYTVFARTAEGKSGISAFVVPAESKGLSIRPQKMLADHPIGELMLEDVWVPDGARIGPEGSGLHLALGTLDVFRATVGAAAVGMAKRALAEALSYAQNRQQFGAPLFGLPAVQAMLADSATELEAARLLVHRAAAIKDAGASRVTLEAAQAKLFATEAAQRIIDRCLQIHGGNGLLEESIVQRLYRSIRALRIYEGASEVQRLVIARHLKLPELPPGRC